VSNKGKNRLSKHCASATATLFVLFCVFFFLDSTTQSNAQSRAQICRGLTNQLNSLGNSRATGGNSKKYRQFTSAVRKQTNQINKANRALRRNGCVGIFKNSKSQCRAIGKSLKRMHANLSNLKKQRAAFAPKRSNNTNKRKRILASLRRNRCNNPNANEVREANNQQKPKSRRRTILEQVFGVRAYDENGNRRNDESNYGDEEFASRLGTFRTLCVRKSDGYYFPISFSTVSDRFEVDEQACQAMCPYSDVALYHHRMPREDSEDMISFATKTPYRDEPFAFAYRKEHNPNNRCRFSTAGINQSVDVQPVGDIEPEKKIVRIGIPVFRKDPSLSPDAYDSLIEGLSVERVKTYFAAIEADNENNGVQVVAANRKIRIVGPAFFPVQ